MGNPTTVELASFADRFAAETIKIRLAAAGIQSEVFGTDAAEAFGMGGAPQRQLVRVEVARQDLLCATDILEQDRQDALERGPWSCTTCNEINEPTFDLCWKCNRPPGPEPKTANRDGLVDTDPLRCDFPLAALPVFDNPYRPILIDPSVAARATDAAMQIEIKRALLASIGGWLLLPPLINLYSIFLLLRLPMRVPRDRTSCVQVVVAWLINLAAVSWWSLYWSGQVALG